MTTTKTCPNCNKQFETNNRQKLYCTPKCTCANHQKKIKSDKKEANVEMFDWKYWKHGII